MHDGPLTKVQV